MSLILSFISRISLKSRLLIILGVVVMSVFLYIRHQDKTIERLNLDKKEQEIVDYKELFKDKRFIEALNNTLENNLSVENMALEDIRISHKHSMENNKSSETAIDVLWEVYEHVK